MGLVWAIIYVHIYTLLCCEDSDTLHIVIRFSNIAQKGVIAASLDLCNETIIDF